MHGRGAETRQDKGTVSLPDMPEGTVCEVVRIEGGRCCQSKLMAVGMRKGAKVQIIRNDGRGPVAVAIGLMRLALGRGMACHVTVVPQDKSE